MTSRTTVSYYVKQEPLRNWSTGSAPISIGMVMDSILFPVDSLISLGYGLYAIFSDDLDIRYGPLGVLVSILPFNTCIPVGFGSYLDFPKRLSAAYAQSPKTVAKEARRYLAQKGNAGDELKIVRGFSQENTRQAKSPVEGKVSVADARGISVEVSTDASGGVRVPTLPFVVAAVEGGQSQTRLTVTAKELRETCSLGIGDFLTALEASRESDFKAYAMANFPGKAVFAALTRTHPEPRIVAWAESALRGLGFAAEALDMPTLRLLRAGEGRVTFPDGAQVNWASGAPQGPPAAEVTLDLDLGGKPVVAGHRFSLTARCTNRGRGAVFQLSGHLAGKLLGARGKLLLFGKVPPGETLTRRIEIQVPATLAPGSYPLRLRFEEANQNLPPEVAAKVLVRVAPKAQLNLSTRYLEDGSGTSLGNGDRVFQPGESVEVQVTLSNLGDAPAREVTLSLSFQAQPGVVAYGAKAFELGEIPAKATRSATFTLTLKRTFKGQSLPFVLNLSHASAQGKELQTVKQDLKVGEALQERVVRIDRELRVLRKTPLFERPNLNSRKLAAVDAGSRLRALGELGEFLEVVYGPEKKRVWISRESTSFDLGKTPGSGGPGRVEVVREFVNTPPLVVIRSSAGRTSASTFRVQGKARDDKLVESLQILLDGEPIDAGLAKGPGAVVKRAKRAGQKELSFDFTIPLHPGSNRIEVVALDAQGLAGRDSIEVERVIEQGTIHAAVIGISAYTKVRRLRYARLDAIAFRDYLLKDLEIPAKNVHVLLDAEATLPRVRRLLGATIPQAAAKGDTVLIFYSGHGGREADASAEGGQAAYLYPVGADEQDLIATAYPMEDLQRSFRRIQAQRLVFMADSCYSGAARDPRAAAQAKGSAKALQILGRQKGRVILSACQPDQVAQESKKHKRGLFTHFLLQGLKGSRADSDRNGFVDTDELFRYIASNVSKASKQTQHPGKSGSGRVVLGGRSR